VYLKQCQNNPSGQPCNDMSQIRERESVAASDFAPTFGGILKPYSIDPGNGGCHHKAINVIDHGMDIAGLAMPVPNVLGRKPCDCALLSQFAWRTSSGKEQSTDSNKPLKAEDLKVRLSPLKSSQALRSRELAWSR